MNLFMRAKHLGPCSASCSTANDKFDLRLLRDLAEAKSRRDFAADNVRHSTARKARLQHSMSKDWIRRTQPHVYITSLLYPHVASSFHATFIPPRPANHRSSRREHDPEDWQVARPRPPFAHGFLLRRERRGRAGL